MFEVVNFVRSLVNYRPSLLLCIGACLCAICVAAAGCSKGPPVGTVHGTVTLDGSPLEEGAIQLTALDGQAPTAGAQIVNGKFKTKAAITKYRVKIVSNVAIGPDGKRIDPNKKVDKFSTRDEVTMKSLVPDMYNKNSTLELDVQPGLNEPVYDLKTK